MGGCVTGEKDPKVEILRKAHKTFKRLDINNNGKINSSDIEKHFGNYSQASAKIMLRQIDLDKDGVISLNEWIGYWEMVRRSGYKPMAIIKQLQNIEDGNLTLNFTDVYNYQKELPRTTVVNSIVDDLKRSPPQKLPFSLQK